MNACCGKKCNTPFCPSCGKGVNPTEPLAELLIYVRKKRAGLEKQIASREDVRDSSERHRKAYGGFLASRDKWQRWESAVEDALSDAGAAQADS